MPHDNDDQDPQVELAVAIAAKRYILHRRRPPNDAQPRRT